MGNSLSGALLRVPFPFGGYFSAREGSSIQGRGGWIFLSHCSQSHFLYSLDGSSHLGVVCAWPDREGMVGRMI